ncbi:thermonuclease family protein [Priestia megaterium]|uniref:Thermonuclease family protein n=1 Tax=Priestia megaterium TaxID=1404 RepID=A0A6H1P7J4_PRIMG|nr:thermonuclease family protein [Priestia megaterium]QIZ09241.1 thermonuclease family protein [Priestia megaterium]
MRKKLVGVSLMAAATVLAFHPMEQLDEENQTNIGIQQDGDQNSGSPVKEASEMPINQIPITLIETIDGDTIKAKVKGGIETIRYLLLDTPESKNPRMCVQPYAKEAFQRNNELVRDGSLAMELEQGNTRDSYGRLLAYVYVDGKSVQETLLREGFARVAYIMNPPYKYLPQYRTDESLAKRSGVNIWSQTGFVTNWGYRGCVP